MPIILNSSQVQQNFGAALERTLRGEDVIIERYGRPQAAMVPYDRYQHLVEVGKEQAEEAMPRTTQRAQLHEAAATYQVGREAPAREAVSSAGAGSYRYVTRVPGICGGQPIIRGTRVPVKAIVGYHKLGLSAEEVATALPNLTLAQIHETLSYYYDHVDEIEQDIRENQLERLVERYGLQVAADGRITLAD
ncbi:DUF433 domain-containing protein [Candidatus Amarolinea aalborgensis]|uniref:DUF433 domain-containing protein n=1 Tax=Candidatus Amarolinea aalborgensis TaxID=2249329 RepID=UPI003BFA2045